MPTTSQALKRPQPPATMPAAAQVRQRALDAADPLRQALATLQLAKLPSSTGSLARKVGELHPYPERTWSWDLAEAYRAVFDHVAEASGSSARAVGGPGRGQG